MKQVELIPAYEWTCDLCGQRNFVSGIVPEMSEEERRELCEEHGIETYTPGDWVLMPTQVECGHCGAEFGTQHYKDDPR